MRTDLESRNYPRGTHLRFDLVVAGPASSIVFLHQIRRPAVIKRWKKLLWELVIHVCLMLNHSNCGRVFRCPRCLSVSLSVLKNKFGHVQLTLAILPQAASACFYLFSSEHRDTRSEVLNTIIYKHTGVQNRPRRHQNDPKSSVSPPTRVDLLRQNYRKSSFTAGANNNNKYNDFRLA